MIFNVKTTGVCSMPANKITFVVSFKDKADTYDAAVERGALSVIKFKDDMSMFIKKDMIKTSTYRVTREMKRVEKILDDGRKDFEYVFSHFETNQTMTMSMDYDKVILFKIIESISKMQNPPTIKFNFELNNKSIAELERQATQQAVQLAQDKAKDMLFALKLNSTKCVESSIVESFNTDRYYDSMTTMDCVYKAKRMSAEEMAESIEPQDVEVQINLISKFEIL